MTQLDTEARDTYYSQRWDQENQLVAPPNPERISILLDQIRDVVTSREQSTLLDVGCGNGWLLDAAFREHGPRCSLSGVEPSEAGALNAARRVPASKVTCGTLDDVAAGARFDIVVCSEVIEHVIDKEAFIAGLSSHLTAGGKLVITTPNARYRKEYFSSPNLIGKEQPTEEWMGASELARALQRVCDDVHVGTFDIEHWYEQHRGVRQLRRWLRRAPGGWRTSKFVEAMLLQKNSLGLYLLATARGRGS